MNDWPAAYGLPTFANHPADSCEWCVACDRATSGAVTAGSSGGGVFTQWPRDLASANASGSAVDEVPGPEVDWSLIANVCEERAVELDRNDPDFMTAAYELDREWLAGKYPVDHTPTCNLFPGYSKDPKTWARGCDCGAMARAAQARLDGHK